MEYKNNQTIVGAVLASILILTIVLVVSNKPKFTEGIFWQVEKDGEVVGHIYGTIHVNEERVTRISKKVMDIFNNSKGFSIEAVSYTHLTLPTNREV